MPRWSRLVRSDQGSPSNPSLIMARLARLCVPGHTHLVTLRAHTGRVLWVDESDRVHLLRCLRQALRSTQVSLNGYAMLRDRLWLLLTPASASAMSRCLQSAGRCYTAYYNRRHGCSGTLWAGRFRGTVVEPGQSLLEALCFVERSPTSAGITSAACDWPWSSASHHLGIESDALVTDTAEYWALGNTPFDRAATYRELLNEPLAPCREEAIADAAIKGWALGSPAFVAQLQVHLDRPLARRRRGRPAKNA